MIIPYHARMNFQILLRAEEGSNPALVEDGASIKDEA
jgi:hypothetical protein